MKIFSSFEVHVKDTILILLIPTRVSCGHIVRNLYLPDEIKLKKGVYDISKGLPTLLSKDFLKTQTIHFSLEKLTINHGILKKNRSLHISDFLLVLD